MKNFSTKPKRDRRPFDFYETPQWQVDALILRSRVGGRILEPCSGDLSLVNALKANRKTRILTNDYDPKRPAQFHYDATKPDGLWEESMISGWKVDWIVTNPPFNSALPILKNSWECARAGVAMLLRLSFLEPTKERSKFLSTNPPSKLIVLPRWSYRANGKTDSVTTAWMIWEKLSDEGSGVLVVPLSEKAKERA